MKPRTLLILGCLLGFAGTVWSAGAPNTQTYEAGALDLVNRTKGKHGSAEQEAELSGAIEKRTSNNGKIKVSEQDKANSPFGMVANVNAQQKTCTQTRSLEIITAKVLVEMAGKFRIRGNDFWTDIKTCQQKIDYNPYQVTIKLPTKVEKASGGFSWSRPTYRGSYDGNATYRYGGGECGAGYNLWTRTYSGNCPGLEANRLLKCNGGNLTYSYSLVSESYTGKLLTYQSYRVDATCKTPQSTKEWRLNRVVTDQCGTLQASCTQLGSSTDAASCQTIKGIRVCEPWWNKTVEYGCTRNYECSAFPESEEVCGPWFAGNMAGCVSTSESGVWSMALQKFRGLVGNMNCNPFKVDDLGAVGIPGGSKYANGCGVFQPSRTDLFRHNGSDSRLINARCLASPAVLPPTMLKEQLTFESQPGGITSTIKTFDYYNEGVKDTCTPMLADMQAQKVTCKLLTETTDGVATFVNGNRMASPAPTSKVFDGQLGSYSFARPFWEVERSYYCPIDPQKANVKPTKQTLAKPQVTETESTDSPGFNQALGSLGVASELAKTVSGDTACKSTNADGSCDYANIELFPGRKESCKLDSPDLSAIFSTCCKAGVKVKCGPNSGLLCVDICNEEDEITSLNVYEKKVDVLAGEHCTDRRCSATPLSYYPGVTVNGQCMGFWICFQKRKYYCNFNSILARIIQKQGREQLGMGFGSGEFPDCRGLTFAEFDQIDMGKMDLTEFFDSLQLDPVGVQQIDPASIRDTIKNGVKNANK